MKPTKVTDVETVQDPALRSCIVQVISVRAPNHVCLKGREHIYTAGTQRLNQNMSHGVLVAV